MRAATRLLNKQEPSPKSDSEIFADNLNRRLGRHAQKLEARKHPLTITLGHWTLHGNDNFIGLTVHFLDNEWHLHSHILGHVFAPGD